MPSQPSDEEQALARAKYEELAAFDPARLSDNQYLSTATAMLRGELVLFFGWGAHYPREARADAPSSWMQVAHELAQRVGFDEPIVTVFDFARLTQHVYETRGEIQFEDYMRELLGRKYSPTLAHWFAAGLPGMLRDKHYRDVPPLTLTAKCTYYHPGVGTMEPPGALTPWRRLLTRVLGQAVGAYLQNDIRDAYAFLMRSYEPGDRVFMFGFSRGAYTVRAVASLLHMYGLLRPGNEALIPYAIRMMMAIQRARRGRKHAAKVDDYFSLAREFKRTVARECKPWFLGVWDTVSSVGWIENPLRLPLSARSRRSTLGRSSTGRSSPRRRMDG